MGVVDDLLRGEAWSRSDASVGQGPACFDVRLVRRPFLHAGSEDVVHVFAPTSACREAFIGEPFRFAHQIGEALKLVFASDLDDEPAV